MKWILFAIYDKFSHDQRALETIKSLSNIGEVTVVSYDKVDNWDKIKFIVSDNGKRNYLQFKKSLKKTYKKLKPDIVFLHDNYAAFFINWLRKKKENVIIGYDSSELYYDKYDISIRGLKSLILNIQEKKYISQTDFVFAANLERAKIMKDVFHLKKCPIVWDNVHRIDDNINKKECDKKFGNIVSNSQNIIFYCGGIHHNRGTFELIEAVKELGNKYKLVIAGTASKEELKEYKKVLNGSSIKNFTYIGFVSRSELKYFLKKSKISVSIFDLSCINHIFCASGKIYESIFEGVPILTSTNPPFTRLCNEYGIGVSTDDYISGIKKIMNNYDEYVNNTKKLIKMLDYDNRIDKLTNLILNEIKHNQRG